MADQRTYNARVTTEALEKKFRDTFPSQAGAELVDDLYASGVIVPTVDFTAAAQGSELRSDLQKSWDFATGIQTISAGSANLATTPGFYRVNLICSTNDFARAAVVTIGFVQIVDSSGTVNTIGRGSTVGQAGTAPEAIKTDSFIVYVRSGDTLRAGTVAASETMNVWYRQVADVNGNLVNPLGFVFS